jgi:hypothetical protein
MFQVFQLFHTYVAKVGLNVAYVAMAIHACFKYMFEVFHLFFNHMLQVFQLNVSKIVMGEHMLQLPQWLRESGLQQSPAIAGGAPPWIVVRAPKASRGLRDAHPRGEAGTMRSNREQRPATGPSEIEKETAAGRAPHTIATIVQNLMGRLK